MALIVLWGFIGSVIFNYIRSQYFHLPFYPYGTFLFDPGDALHDFIGSHIMNTDNDPFRIVLRSLGNNYPPFGYAILLPFTMIPLKAGIIFYLVTIVAGFFYFLKQTVCVPEGRGGWNWFFLPIFGLCTYPFLFAMDRANTEDFIFLWVVAFFLLYGAKRHRPAAFFLGGAAASKVYPGLFSFLYLRDKKYKEFVLVLLSMAFFTVASMVVFRVNLTQLLDSYSRSMPRFKSIILAAGNDCFSSSIFSSFRFLAALILGPEKVYSPEFSAQALSVYMPISLAILIVYLVGILSRGVELWESLVLIVCALILVPQTSFDYKLLHLFIPFAAFLTAHTDRRTGLYYSVLFGVLFIPKNFFIFWNISIQGTLNVLCLLLMSWPILKKGLRPQVLRETVKYYLRPGSL